MAHQILDKLAYEALTGECLDDSQTPRFNMVSEYVQAKLEEMLGWPLNPEDWANQYVEIGKSKSNLSCPDVDDDLDPPDAVIGAYRFFTLQVGDPWLAIDPATEIHAVKYIRGEVTCKEYDTDEYVPKYGNGSPSTVRFIGIRKLMCDCVRIREPRSFAVDADWAYANTDDGESTLPMELKKVLADMIGEEMNPKKDIKSESVVSHSYTKYDKTSVIEQSMQTIQRYAGPHGLATRRLT